MTRKEKDQLYRKLGALAVDMPHDTRQRPMVLLSDIRIVLALFEEATEDNGKTINYCNDESKSGGAPNIQT